MTKIVLFLALFFPVAVSAEVSKIIFITESQSISPDTLSEAITIQTVDSDGNEFKTPETLDLQFKSTSATGSFLNSSGNPATDYMSKNTAKRTFYYKDSDMGDFTLTITATGRDSGKEWSTSQDILVGDSPSSDSSSQSQSSSPGNSLGSSSGSSSAPKANGSELLEISAGGDRVVSVGSPVDFRASVKKNSTGDGVVFAWSYGDGYVGTGLWASHTYLYPGNYAVTLSAKTGSNSATHKVKVKVVEPKISLALGEGYIEISNDTQNDVNIFNWKIVSEGRAFIFQPDTIILAGSKIKIPKSLLLMKGQAESGTLLKDTLGQVVASYVSPAAIPAAYPIAKTVQTGYQPKPVAAAVAGTSTLVVAAEPEALPVIYEAPVRRGLVSRTFGFFAKIFK